MEAAIQLLSAVLGIVAAVAVAALCLEDAGSVVLVTVVFVVMFVLGDVAVKLQVVGFGPDPAGSDTLRAWSRLSIRERRDALWPPHSVPSLNYCVNMI